jgi:hypothetical protein
MNKSYVSKFICHFGNIGLSFSKNETVVLQNTWMFTFDRNRQMLPSNFLLMYFPNSIILEFKLYHEFVTIFFSLFYGFETTYYIFLAFYCYLNLHFMMTNICRCSFFAFYITISVVKCIYCVLFSSAIC